MKTVKANNFPKASREVAAFEKQNNLKSGTLTNVLPDEIQQASSESHYHLFLIKKRHDAKNEKYIINASVRTFSKGRAFEKIEKNYQIHGFSSLIVLHDPSAQVLARKAEEKKAEEKKNKQ